MTSEVLEKGQGKGGGNEKKRGHKNGRRKKRWSSKIERKDVKTKQE